MTTGRWSELPIGFARFHDVFADQFLPQREMLAVLSLTVIRLVRVADASLRICRSFSGFTLEFRHRQSLEFEMGPTFESGQ